MMIGIAIAVDAPASEASQPPEDVLTDDSGNVLTDDSGNPLTPAE